MTTENFLSHKVIPATKSFYLIVPNFQTSKLANFAILFRAQVTVPINENRHPLVYAYGHTT